MYGEQTIEVIQEHREQTIPIVSEPIIVGGSGEISITENGNYDVKPYETADVNIKTYEQEYQQALDDLTASQQRVRELEDQNAVLETDLRAARLELATAWDKAMILLYG